MTWRKQTMENNFVIIFYRGKVTFLRMFRPASDGPAGRWWTSLAQRWQKRSSSCWIMQPEDSVTSPLNINPQRGKRRSEPPPPPAPHPLCPSEARLSPPLRCQTTHTYLALQSCVHSCRWLRGQVYSLLPLCSAGQCLFNQLKQFRLCLRGAAAGFAAAAIAAAGTSTSLRWRRWGGCFALRRGD